MTRPRNLKTGYAPYTSLQFAAAERQARALACVIQERLGNLTDVLLRYESHEVARDEIARTLDLLLNLHENAKYFRLRVGSVTAFLPRNQPLYALACFVLVPSLMASEVHFRVPQSMRGFLPELLELLGIPALFPNVVVSPKPRLEFLRERSALLVNPKTGVSQPRTDAVIFTGTPVHADQLRRVFDKRTLFIANGAGHNPVVISRDANLSRAVEAVLTLQFYNQGQDCAAPNSILVHREVMSDFLSLLRNGVRATAIGQYRDVTCRIGPISEPGDLVRIQDFLVQHREWLDPSTPGVVRVTDAIVEPVIVCKPLAKGGNYGEIFAPIIFVQEYADDPALAQYFEDPRYAQHAMYVTLYGTSAYVSALIGRTVAGRILHKQPSFLRDTHLHALGMERGTQPYGGYGPGASSISINGKTVSVPTLPQRDIFEYVAAPILRKKAAAARRAALRSCTKLQYRNVEQLLRTQSRQGSPHDGSEAFSPHAHVDAHSLKTEGVRYVRIPESNLYRLLARPNTGYGNALEPERRAAIHALRTLLRGKSTMAFDVFRTALYAIPVGANAGASHAKTLQRRFFGDVYQLLFGKAFGPRLARFLWDVDDKETLKLLAAARYR